MDIPMNLSNAFSQTSRAVSTGSGPLICFSHLRWDFVLQRPQHLMQRFSQTRPVFFFEEYIPTDHHLAYLEIHPFEGTSVKAVRPRVPHGWDEAAREQALARLLDELLAVHGGGRPVLWFYTPAMYGFARHVDAAAVIYDCMDELANFKFAAPQLKIMETALIARADVVFTGGYSLYEAKRHLHDNIHPFPSSVDTRHFRAARLPMPEPADQAGIAGPKLGYYGVIDERLDLALIADLARARPDWSIVLIGPVAKIAAADLPRAKNIHYLGQKAYADLPAYLAGWDVALMPFAQNEATRFISPTKTPEYLASGRPVVGTPITDVVRHYGDVPGVFLAAGAAGFIAACEAALELAASDSDWRDDVDAVLAGSSWDDTAGRMQALVEEACSRALPEPVSIDRRATKTTSKRSATAYDYLIVGAGFAGSVLAERLASDGGKRVLLCDRRPHVGGNAYDFYNDDGILVHRYGPHIFHTNSEDVFDYLSRFTGWRPYEHRVLADTGGQRLPIPINRTTLNGLYGLDLSNDAEAALFLASRAEPQEKIVTSKDVVVSQVGSHLYRTFFEGYTRKQWGLDPAQLDKAVTARIPTRTSTDDRYFLDTFQAMPIDGYTKMFEAMLDHPNITLMLGTEFQQLRQPAVAAHTIFTGPIDEFFDYRFGRLPYRSLKFQHETHDLRRMLPVGVVNYPDEAVPYTRITEYKHLTGQVHPKTSISYEYACADGDPYYPIPRPENQALYKQYEALSRERDDVTFVGRLGTYKYYNMDQVVGQALATYRRMQKADAAVSNISAAGSHE
jgi:UDP-galactopyranose mutase